MRKAKGAVGRRKSRGKTLQQLLTPLVPCAGGTSEHSHQRSMEYSSLCSARPIFLATVCAAAAAAAQRGLRVYVGGGGEAVQRGKMHGKQEPQACAGGTLQSGRIRAGRACGTTGETTFQGGYDAGRGAAVTAAMTTLGRRATCPSGQSWPPASQQLLVPGIGAI